MALGLAVVSIPNVCRFRQMGRASAICSELGPNVLGPNGLGPKRVSFSETRNAFSVGKTVARIGKCHSFAVERGLGSRGQGEEVVNGLLGSPSLLRCCEWWSPEECLNLRILDGESVKQPEGVADIGSMEDSEFV